MQVFMLACVMCVKGKILWKWSKQKKSDVTGRNDKKLQQKKKKKTKYENVLFELLLRAPCPPDFYLTCSDCVYFENFSLTLMLLAWMSWLVVSSWKLTQSALCSFTWFLSEIDKLVKIKNIHAQLRQLRYSRKVCKMTKFVQWNFLVRMTDKWQTVFSRLLFFFSSNNNVKWTVKDGVNCDLLFRIWLNAQAKRFCTIAKLGVCLESHY